MPRRPLRLAQRPLAGGLVLLLLVVLERSVRGERRLLLPFLEAPDGSGWRFNTELATITLIPPMRHINGSCYFRHHPYPPSACEREWVSGGRSRRRRRRRALAKRRAGHAGRRAS